MTSITFDELLKRAGEFERRLEGYYAEIRDRTENNGVKLLTYYLSRHRRHLERAKEALTPERMARIGSVRLKFDVPFDPRSSFTLMGTAPEVVGSRELLDAAVGYDTQLVALYREILDQPVGNEAQEFIESLIKLEEKDIVMLKKIIAMDYF